MKLHVALISNTRPPVCVKTDVVIIVERTLVTQRAARIRRRCAAAVECLVVGVQARARRRLVGAADPDTLCVLDARARSLADVRATVRVRH